MRGTGVRRVVVGGLADDYVNYVTTPPEYDWQAYEGGSTVYGRNEATFFQERLAELGTAIVNRTAAPAPHVYDASYGVHPSDARFAPGAASGAITSQPDASYDRGDLAQLAWDGGPDGHDMPVDAAFVTAQRQVGTRWRTADTDLGLNMLWRATSQGHYEATWHIPASAVAGTYRLVVTASRYRLESRPFAITR